MVLFKKYYYGVCVCKEWRTWFILYKINTNLHIVFGPLNVYIFNLYVWEFKVHVVVTQKKKKLIVLCNIFVDFEFCV